MTSTLARSVAACSAVGLIALFAGCGGDDKNGGSDFADQSGEKIADTAKADMRALDQVKFSGEIASSSGQVTLDVQADANGDCTGTIGLGGGTAEIRAKDGTNWFKPDEAFWRGNAGDQADAIISAVGDKWVLDTDENFSQFCDLGAFFDNIFKESSGAGDYKVTGTDEIDGQKVVKVAQTDDQGTATGYVLVDGKHYLVKLERTEGDEPGHLEFSEFDKEFDVEAPAADEVVDLSGAAG